MNHLRVRTCTDHQIKLEPPNIKLTTQEYIPKCGAANWLNKVGSFEMHQNQVENRPAGAEKLPKKNSIEGTHSQRTEAAFFDVNAKFGRPLSTGLSYADWRRRKELLPPHYTVVSGSGRAA